MCGTRWFLAEMVVDGEARRRRVVVVAVDGEVRRKRVVVVVVVGKGC